MKEKDINDINNIEDKLKFDNFYLAAYNLILSKLNKEGYPIFGNITMNEGYSPDAQVVQPYNSDYYFLHYHNKKNLAGHEEKEKTLTFKDKNLIIDNVNRKK